MPSDPEALDLAPIAANQAGVSDVDTPDQSDADSSRIAPVSPTIALLGGALAAVNGPSPTGQVSVDVLLVAGFTAGVIWFSSVVPVRFAAAIALMAGCASVTWPGLAIGVAAYLAAAGNSESRTRPNWISTVLVAVALNLATRSDLSWFFGASAAIGVAIATIAVARAIPIRSRRDRRRLAATVGVVALLTVGGGVPLAAAGANSRADLRTGEQTVKRGLDELLAGDIDVAVASFDEAEASFDRAHDKLSSPLTALAAVVPIVAQHRRTGVELTAGARQAAETLSDELGPIDLDQLSFSNGRIDIDAIAALAEPLASVRTDVAELRGTVADLDDPWLVGPVRDRLDELQVDITEQLDRSAQFVDLVDRVPAMLGREGPRHYFVAFTTPSEVRGLGGFMGNWAEVTIDDGAIELAQFGRSGDLDEAAEPGERIISGPQDWLDRYGQFGFDNGPGGRVNREPWKNITMSASMKSTGQVIAELYPQSGGREIDGVFVMDVFAVAALLELTGPIELPEGQGRITSENAPRFLLKDQYDEDDKDERVDVLETVSNRAFETLLESELPPPIDIVELMGPLVERGHIAAFADAPAEQALLERSGLSGTLDDPEGRDGIAITYNNAIGNKIDFYLHSSAEYRVVADPEAGSAEATLELTMENRAPRAGDPFYVIGNPFDKPLGTNRSIVSVYSQLPLVTARLDGVDVVTEQTTEAGYFVTGVLVELRAGAKSTLTLDFAGTLDLDEGYALVLRTPPLATDIDASVHATLLTDSGDRVERQEFPGAGRHELTIGRSGG